MGRRFVVAEELAGMKVADSGEGLDWDVALLQESRLLSLKITLKLNDLPRAARIEEMLGCWSAILTFVLFRR